MFKVHSEVALITNSSTAIYSIASERTIQKAKDLVNAILAKVFNAGVTADDLFDFSLEWDYSTIERAYYLLIGNPIEYGIPSEDEYDGDEEYTEYVEKIAVARLDEGWVPYGEYGRCNVQNLVVTDKDGNPVDDFMAFFHSIRNEAVYD